MVELEGGMLDWCTGNDVESGCHMAQVDVTSDLRVAY